MRVKRSSTGKHRPLDRGVAGGLRAGNRLAGQAVTVVVGCLAREKVSACEVARHEAVLSERGKSAKIQSRPGFIGTSGGFLVH